MLLPRKQHPYKVPGVDKSNLRLNQDRLKNIVCIHPTTVSHMSPRQCADHRASEAESPKEKQPHTDTNSDEVRNGTDSTYVVDKLVQQIGYET